MHRKWKVDIGRNTVYVKEDNDIEREVAAILINNYIAKSPEQHKAEAVEKAKLIAAAPDLLEACKKYLRGVECGVPKLKEQLKHSLTFNAIKDAVDKATQ